MKKIKLISFLCLASALQFLQGQEKYTISGYITDQESGERLPYANITTKDGARGTVSNDYGFYSLTLPEGKHELVFSYIGYQPLLEIVQLDVNLEKHAQLFPTLEIEEVTIMANHSRYQPGRMERLKLKEIKKIPVGLGEPDILRVAQYLPGISGGTEGNTGLVVRGGHYDQNLYMLDGVPMFNTNHLFGFFSVFNPDAIKDISVYKHSFPARYGGRLSSVVDIKMKDGNMHQTTGNLAAGLLAARGSIEGPIIKNKASYIISARRTFVDLLLSPFKNNLGEFSGTGYYFYDLNGKINYILSERSRLYISAYYGKDDLDILDEEERKVGKDYSKTTHAEDLEWGNFVSSLRWNYLISSKLFFNFTLAQGQYKYDSKVRDGFLSYEDLGHSIDNVVKTDRGFDSYSGINYSIVRANLNFYPSPVYKMNTGLHYRYTELNPMARSKSLELNSLTTGAEKYTNEIYNINEGSAYIENIIKFFNNFELDVGARFNYYTNDTTYLNMDPRLSLSYTINPGWVATVGYTEMIQHIRTLSFSNVQLANEIIVSSNKKFAPAKSRQTSFSIDGELTKGYSFSTGLFYKYMDNLIEYREGASYANQLVNWADLATSGKGQSYGAELMLKKEEGKTTGWLAYTLSKSDRVFELINRGEVFPYKYDRRHDFNLVLNHEFNEKWTAGLVWVISSGIWISGARGIFPEVFTFNYNLDEGRNYESNTIDYRRNTARLTTYHRLDVSVSYHMVHRNNNRSSLTAGLYNAYNAKNPYTGYLQIASRGYGNLPPTIFGSINQKSLIPLLPHITYNYQF
jgi:hypothetical protein